MNKMLLRIGGAVNLLFVLFHLSMVQSIGEAVAPPSLDIRATVSTLNVQVAFTLLIFAYFAIFRPRDLLTTRLGNMLAIAISLFWFLRGVNQVVFYGLTAAGIPLLGLCLVFALLHLIPMLREWKNVTEHIVPVMGDPRSVAQGAKSMARLPTERHVGSALKSQGPIARTPWASYAAVVWCVVFGGFHLYWALGGTFGFADFSMPSNKILALTRDPLYIGITWGVVVACVCAAIAALAPFQAWSRRIPRWLLLSPLWIACGMFLLRGFGNPIQSALLIAGGMPFEPLAGPDAQAWYHWLLIDAVFFSPWFILGGAAFGATAHSARRLSA